MANAKSSAKTDKTKSVKIEFTNLENIRPLYSNYVLITHTSHEFVINFCYVDKAKISKGENKKVPAECFSRVVISPSFLPNVIEAFKINQEKYNEHIQKEIKRMKKGEKK